MEHDNEAVLQSLLILAIKEIGEIADCVVKGEKDRPGHWKNELGDLCGLAVLPLLAFAEMTYDEACVLGIERKREKLCHPD